MIEETEELQGQLIASGNVVASMVATKGAKGEPGQDGFSPIVETSKVGKVTTISITDAEGTTTATINDGEDGETGQPGADGYSPSASVSKVGKIATITITDKNGTTTTEIRDGEDGQGSGDMLKSTYDTDNNGIVDNAEKVNNHTVLSDVPADAVFTDTTYTAGTNVSISAGNVISATDTTYTAGTGIDITAGVISNTQTSASWGNITGTLSNQTDLKNVLDKKQDLTPARLTDTSIGTSSNPYILDTMTPGYYFIETPSGGSTRYFKLTSSASGSISISSSASGDGFGFYLYIPETIDTPNLNNGDVVCYFDRISISSAGYTSGGLICYVYDPSKSPKIGLDNLKSYNRNFGTAITASAQTWKGVKTFNDVPVCATAPTNNSDLANKKYIDDGLSAKQDTLVSGTNIKTINGTSVLGSGDIDAGASIPIQNTAPLNPEEDDLWIDTGNDNQLKYYNGANWEDVNSQITGDTLPIGSIVPYGNSTAPANWLVCDGSTYSVDDYPQLYAVIGNTYGGDALQGTFAVPNLKGRVAVGQDTTQTEFDTIGETGGSKYLQAHNHRVFASYGTGSSTIDAIRFQTGQAGGQYYDYGYGQNIFIESTGTGNSGNLQPYQVVCYIIKAFQSAGNISQVNNTNSNSNVDTYSCNYINDCNSYSTSETFTGKHWVDGKPIYKKTIDCGALPNTDTKNVAHNIASFNRIINIYGYAYASTSQNSVPLPFSSPTNTLNVLVMAGTTNITILTGTDQSVFNESYITLEYTKTTD